MWRLTSQKMTHRCDPRLHGREPEFARMSLRPGIGAVAITPVVSFCAQTRQVVPSGLRYGDRRLLPLGRYLRKKIAGELGGGNEAHSQAWLGTSVQAAKNSKALSTLRAYAQAVDKPVENCWSEVLASAGYSVVIPDIPVIHRLTNNREV